MTKLVKDGVLERYGRSIYVIRDVREDEFYLMQERYVKGNYEIGITRIQSHSLNPIWVYDLERTLGDILRGSGADISLVVDAYKRYAASKEKNVFKRMQ